MLGAEMNMYFYIMGANPYFRDMLLDEERVLDLKVPYD